MYIKINRSTRGFVFKVFVFLQYAFLAFYVVFRKQNGLFFFFFLIYIMPTHLIRFWFFLIPGFVSANFQFELFVRDTFSALQVFFLSFSFFFLLFYFTRLYSSCLCVCVGAHVHER